MGNLFYVREVIREIPGPRRIIKVRFSVFLNLHPVFTGRMLNPPHVEKRVCILDAV